MSEKIPKIDTSLDGSDRVRPRKSEKEIAEQIIRISDKLLDRAEKLDESDILHKTNLLGSKRVHARIYRTPGPFDYLKEGEESFTVKTSRMSGSMGSSRQQPIAAELNHHVNVEQWVPGIKYGVYDDTTISVNPSGRNTGREIEQAEGIRANSIKGSRHQELSTEEMVSASARILKGVKGNIQKREKGAKK